LPEKRHLAKIFYLEAHNYICAVEKILACPLYFNRNPAILGLCCNVGGAK